MPVSLSAEDILELEHGLTALRTANSQSNAKSAEIKAWFRTHTKQLVAASLINEAKQIGNRLKEQRGKLAPYTLFFSASTDISDRTQGRLGQYVYPGLKAVFFFVEDAGVYKLRSIAIAKSGDDFAAALRAHYQSVDSVNDVEMPEPQVVTWGGSSPNGTTSSEDLSKASQLEEGDSVLMSVLNAAEDGYAGVILVGPPGTGKSRYAAQIAAHLTDGDPHRVEFVQFHPSYQYEDFIQGFTPTATSFEPEWKVFAKLCHAAELAPADKTFVMVIDELSRTDTARVFGEALTYIEMDKRGRAFTLASGALLTIPKNVFILATMNPWDRGVDDVDVALERRFAEVPVLPSEKGLRAILAEGDLSEEVIEGVVAFFNKLQTLDNEHCRIGHAYFVHGKNSLMLERLWGFRLHPYFKRASRSDRGTLARIEGLWRQLVVSVINPPENPASQNASAEPSEA